MAMMGGSPHSGGDDIQENSEINVTPFIDVMLVLLIIFMVAAPLATVSVPVDLPAAQAEAQPKPPTPVYVTLSADLTLHVDEQTVEEGQLLAALDAATHGNKDQRLFLRADESVDYGDLMEAMNQLRQIGYLKVALVGLEQVQ